MRTHSIIGLSILTIGYGTYLSSGALLLLGYSIFGLLLLASKKSKSPEINTSSCRSRKATIDLPQDMFAEPAIRDHVRKVANKITRAAGLRDDLFSFYVLQSPDIFGFADNTSNVVISSGLYEDCRREDELAAVLAHEIGHLQIKTSDRSGLTGVRNSDGYEQLREGQQKGHLQLIHCCADPRKRKFLALISKLRVSRQREYEADQLSIQFLKCAGYDTNALARFLWRCMLNDHKNGNKSFLPNLLSTHPSALERIQAVNENLLKSSK
jgi:predicted Zn-dependent protease